MARPKFTKNQTVCFIGGIGRIESYQLDSSTWAYNVEMKIGQALDLGRVGSETTIFLHEEDIQGVLN